MGILDWFRKPASTGPEHDQAALREAIEQTVVDTDPRVRLVGGYQKRLAPAVAMTLGYARQLVAQLPQAMELSVAAWSTHPGVRQAFATAEGVKVALSRSTELRSFFEQPEHGLASDACALLVINLREVTRLGMGLEGDRVRADVLQRIVDLYGHRVVAPGSDESAVRNELEKRVFKHVLTQALARLTEIGSRKLGLTQERELLKTRFAYVRQRGQGLDALLEPENRGPAELQKLEQALAENARQLGKLNTSGFEESLNVIRSSLSHPEEALTLETQKIRVNPMNIIVESGSEEPSREFTPFVVTLRTDPPVTALVRLVRCSRTELISKQQMLEDAKRFL
ncbi:MAG TPA: hypothetical protein VLA73_04695 [Burkholderiales bacterium]|nr:hypothetical protein [Burkholderiales bacterium]